MSTPLPPSIIRHDDGTHTVVGSAVPLTPFAPPMKNEQEGVAVVQPQPDWERYFKQALAAVVIGCGSALTLLSPTEDAFAFKACTIVVAVGAGLGITSRGNAPKK